MIFTIAFISNSIITIITAVDYLVAKWLLPHKKPSIPSWQTLVTLLNQLNSDHKYVQLSKALHRFSMRRNRHRRFLSTFQVLFRSAVSRIAYQGFRWLIASYSACRTWGRARAPSSDSFVARAGKCFVWASLAVSDCSRGCQLHFRSLSSNRNAPSSSSNYAWPSSSSLVPQLTIHSCSLKASISSAYCRGFAPGRHSQQRGTTSLPMITWLALGFDSY